MKNAIRLVAASALLMSAGAVFSQQAAPVAAVAAEPRNVVQLSAAGMVQVEQDMLTITLMANKEAPTLAAAQTQLKQALDEALTQAKVGAQPGQMVVFTGTFSRYPRYGKDQKVLGWQGRAELRLEGRDYIEGYVRALTHELKSPVAAIRGAGELLQDELPAADRAEFATQVVQQSERLQRLIDRLLELSKLEQRQHAEGSAPVALHDCAAAAIAHTQGRAAQRGVALEISGQGHSGPWEAELITLAIGNLLDNAIDFAPAGSTVRVEREGATVAVQDAGPGVPDYALPRLGERFFTTARPGGERSGSGLGLAIVQRVMVLHGGQMQVRNTAPGLRVTLNLGR